jgi:hypothetical protein
MTCVIRLLGRVKLNLEACAHHVKTVLINFTRPLGASQLFTNGFKAVPK